MGIEHEHRTICWSGGTEENDVTGIYGLCTTCGGARAFNCGARHWAIDLCRCQPRPEPESSDASETSMPCKLCRACGLELTCGHSKWRLLVCTPCRPLLKTFNSRVGRKVLPQGIHSMVNGGPLLALDPEPTKEQFGAFAAGLNGMFNSISAFHRWGDALIVGRLRHFGIAEGLVIRLEDYLDRCRLAGIDRSTGWRLLEEEWFADA